jgi:hypothetical protein
VTQDSLTEVFVLLVGKSQLVVETLRILHIPVLEIQVLSLYAIVVQMSDHSVPGTLSSADLFHTPWNPWDVEIAYARWSGSNQQLLRVRDLRGQEERWYHLKLDLKMLSVVSDARQWTRTEDSLSHLLHSSSILLTFYPRTGHLLEGQQC